MNQYQSITSPTIPPSGARRQDAKGKLLHDGTRAYQWDSKNRLLKVPRQDLRGRAGKVSYRYDAFGNILVTQGEKALENECRFSTKPLDEVNGLYYYSYRYYDPVTSRWPSRDPLEEEMLDWGEEQGFADKIGSYSVKGARGATPYEQLPGDTVEMAKDFAGDIEKACSGEEW